MASQYKRFADLLKELELFDTYFPVLQENGFDDWEAITYLSEANLGEIGITDQNIAKQIITCAQAASEVADDQENKEPNESQSDLGPIVEINEQMLLKGTSFKKLKTETNQKFFAKITHLSLNDHAISFISNLESFSKLQILYLYNNKITKIDGIQHLTTLTQLHLQRNYISKIENLNTLVHLQKLYLDNNCISVIEGLEYCDQLEELYISNQRIKGELQFDLNSLAVISRSLRILECDNNKIADVSKLAYLDSVEKLSIKNNLIEDLEPFEKMLACMVRLRDLDFRGNYIEKAPKIRDQVIMMSTSLEIFNTKQILENEKAFIMKFYNIKSRGSSTKNTLTSKEKIELGINGNIVVGDSNMRRTDVLNKATDFHTANVHTNSKKDLYKL